MNDKIVRITFTKESGRKPYDQNLRDLQGKQEQAMVNVSANHPGHVQLCAMIASNGILLKSTTTHVEYVAPSQIERVEIIYQTGILNKLGSALKGEA